MKKTKISVILLILAIAISLTIIAIPTTVAQPPVTKETYAFIGATPNPVGVNQEVLLHFGIFTALVSADEGYEDLTITVIDPTGSEEILGPYRTDSTGGTGKIFTPTMTGIYTFQSHFPEQVYPDFSPFLGLFPGTILRASNSETIELVVQEDPLPDYPDHPLPSEYWTRPIDAQLREWSTVSGNWLLLQDLNMVAPYNDGPESAHILWTKQMTTGGLAGGNLGVQSMEDGDAYQGKFNYPIIMNGRLFYRDGSTTDQWQRVVCVDLHTGEEIWRKTLLDNRTVAFGQQLYFDTYNYHGVFDYLWVTVDSTWYAFDPFNGDLVYTMTNVPTSVGLLGPGTFPVFGPKGEILIYEVNTQNDWMTLWNSTNIPDLGVIMPGMANPLDQWSPQGKIVNATGPCPVTATTPDGIAGYMWNKTIPTGLMGGVSRILEDKIIGTDIGFAGWVPRDTPISIWAISTAPGEEGELIFNTTWQPPTGNLTIGFAAASLEDNVFVISSKETRQFWGFSLSTGDEIWGPTDPQHYMDAYHITFPTNFPPDVWGIGISPIAYGKLFSTSWGGIVYAYNATTGKLEWTYNAHDPYNEILWGNNWPLRTLFITDGKIYIAHDEHSAMDPKPRGAPTICLNVTNGDEIWRIDGAFRQTYWGGRAIIGDSIIATQDTYDQRIYAIGKGPSATTVEAPLTAISQGTSVVIRGSVMDVSPGTQDPALQMRFPNGVSAIADEDMSEWMLYVYKQFECPADVEGVEVFLKIQDPNGDYHSTYVTTDANGMFIHSWAPAVVGDHHVTAMFEGSESYFPSQATTAFTVDQAPPDLGYQGPSVDDIAAETARRTIAMLPAYPTTEVPAYLTIDLVILIIAAIGVVIGLIAFMALRKQK